MLTAKREHGTREWRKLRNKKLHHLYSIISCSHDQIDGMRRAGYTHLEQMRNVCSISMTEPEMKAVGDLGVDGR